VKVVLSAASFIDTEKVHFPGQSRPSQSAVTTFRQHYARTRLRVTVVRISRARLRPTWANECIFLHIRCRALFLDKS